MDFDSLLPIRAGVPTTTVARLLLTSLLGVVSVAVATAILIGLQSQLTTSTVVLIYLLPVLISTAFWGLSAGVVASVCAFLAFNYFFLVPRYTLIVHHAPDVLALFVFLIVAVIISNLIGRVKSSLSAMQAREREVLHLYEMSQAISGARDRTTIARLFAAKLAEAFEPAIIEISLFTQRGIMTVRAPEGKASRGVPSYIVPLAAVRGALGEVRMWCDANLNERDDRLLRALIGQAAVALERAMFVESETRATILEESDRLKSALLNSVSHELRTPLVTIKAAATSLRRGTVDRHSEAADDLLAALEEEADRLNGLVGNLLHMSRIEAGALKLERQWNVLAEIVDTSITRMRSAADRHTLEVDVSEDLPLVPVDHVLMQQVLNNLLSNSLKYAPAGTAVRVEATVQDEAILVRVQNEGPQVDEAHLEHIFDKFHRVTEADKIEGTGLGLSICKGIVEAHEGRIWAENLSDGFAFNFTIPLTGKGISEPKLPADSETL